MVTEADLPAIEEYWGKQRDRSPASFILQEDLTGDGLTEVVMPVRDRDNQCLWKLIAIHHDKKHYKLYEVDNSERYGGPCKEGKPWFGFELDAHGAQVNVHYVSESCAVAAFTWNKNMYIEVRNEG